MPPTNQPIKLRKWEVTIIYDSCTGKVTTTQIMRSQTLKFAIERAFREVGHHSKAIVNITASEVQ